MSLFSLQIALSSPSRAERIVGRDETAALLAIAAQETRRYEKGGERRKESAKKTIFSPLFAQMQNKHEHKGRESTS